MNSEVCSTILELRKIFEGALGEGARSRFKAIARNLLPSGVLMFKMVTRWLVAGDRRGKVEAGCCTRADAEGKWCR